MDPEITAQRFGRVVYFEDRVQNQSCEVPRSPLMQSADTAKYIYTDNIHNITSLPLVLKTWERERKEDIPYSCTKARMRELNNSWRDYKLLRDEASMHLCSKFLREKSLIARVILIEKSLKF